MNELLRVLLEETPAPDDPDALDPEFIERWAVPALTPVREHYFRTEVEGIEHLPREGPVMAVSHHSGGPMLPDCWMMLSYYWSHFGFERPGYCLVHDVAFRAPLFGSLISKLGALRASPANAEKVFDRGGLLLVFPGGELDCYRSFARRNTVDVFGRKGFVRLAMRRGVPIVPVVNVGGHETSFIVFSGRRIARWTGIERLTRVKTVPLNVGLPWGVWPTGFVPFLPLPAKLSYKVGKPFYFRPDAGLHEDEDAVDRAYLAVQNAMQDMVDDLASRRRLPVIG